MNLMSRRAFIGYSALAATLLTQAACADGQAALPALNEPQEGAENGDEGMSIDTVISNNHGHQLLLSPEDALIHLRASKTKDVTLSIQGQSSHPHVVVLTHQMLLQIFVDGVVNVNSSEDFSHNHTVSISLLV